VNQSGESVVDVRQQCPGRGYGQEAIRVTPDQANTFAQFIRAILVE
jgi:hypothetical protein